MLRTLALTFVLLAALVCFNAAPTALAAAEEHAEQGAASTEHHEEHGEAPTVFAGTIAQSIAAALVFLILVAILYRSAWGPILKGLQDRERKIKSDLEHAEQSSRDANATLEKYKAQLADAGVEARKMIEQGRADAERLAGQLKDQTQSEINQMKQRAQADIRAAKEQALAEIYNRAATLATDVAGRILKREIQSQDQQRLVEESLAELDSQKN